MGEIELFCQCEDDIYIVIHPLSINQEKILYHRQTWTRLESIRVEPSRQKPILVKANDIKYISTLLLHSNNFVSLNQ